MRFCIGLHQGHVRRGRRSLDIVVVVDDCRRFRGLIGL